MDIVAGLWHFICKRVTMYWKFSAYAYTLSKHVYSLQTLKGIVCSTVLILKSNYLKHKYVTPAFIIAFLTFNTNLLFSQGLGGSHALDDWVPLTRPFLRHWICPSVDTFRFVPLAAVYFIVQMAIPATNKIPYPLNVVCIFYSKLSPICPAIT